MSRFLHCLWATFYIFILGNGVVAIPLLLGKYLFGMPAWNYLEDAWSNSSCIAIVAIGIFSIALAIWDGQFISGFVKETHWFNRTKNDA